MKKLILILCLVGGFDLAASAAPDSARIERRDARRAEALAMPRSFLSVGVGVPSSIFGQGGGVYYNRQSTLLFSVAYTYRVWKFLEVGGSVGYSYSSRYRSSNDQREEFSSLFVSAFARYVWFNSRWVSLYSSLGLFSGIGWGVENEKSYFAAGLLSNYPVLPEASPIGVRVGRRFYGYAEPFCFNGRGFFLQGGLGYRF